MAIKKKKDNQHTPIENGVPTETEVEAIKTTEKRKETDGANTERLRLATNVISEQFGIDQSYKVCKFDDKLKVVSLTLENSDFIIAVTIKNSERHGMVVE